MMKLTFFDFSIAKHCNFIQDKEKLFYNDPLFLLKSVFFK